MELLRHASIFALLTLVIAFAPLAMALVYIVRPTEGRLALMRPFSLAGIFAALSGTMLGLINVLRGIALAQESSADTYRIAVIGASESLVPVFVGFACLTVAWLLVALGMNRSRDELP